MMALQHALIRTVSGSGSVSGSDGFQAVGTTVQLTATPQSGYQFAGWAGSASGTANPLTLVMDGPKSVVAQFTPAPVSVRFESNIAGAQFTVSGSGCPAGTYTAPLSLSWLNGSGCGIAVASPVGGPDSRFVFSGWADGPTSNARTITASPGAVYTFALATEHRLTRGVSGQGSVSGADGFHAAGSTVQLVATPQAGYQFAGWSGSISGSANPVSFVMDGAKSVVANFTTAPVSIRIASNVSATQFTVSARDVLPALTRLRLTSRGRSGRHARLRSRRRKAERTRGTPFQDGLMDSRPALERSRLRQARCTRCTSRPSTS